MKLGLSSAVQFAAGIDHEATTATRKKKGWRKEFMESFREQDREVEKAPDSQTSKIAIYIFVSAVGLVLAFALGLFSSKTRKQFLMKSTPILLVFS